MAQQTSKNGMARIALLGIFALFLAAGISMFVAQKAGAPDAETAERNRAGTAEREENPRETIAPGEAAGTTDDESGYRGAMLGGTSAPLLDFKKADYDKALASGKLVMLYFYANWCPICKAEFPKAQAAFNGLTTEGIIGFRVNYDDDQTDADEKALARQFGVTYQHTKIFMRDGVMLDKFLDSWSEERYAAEIKTRL